MGGWGGSGKWVFGLLVEMMENGGLHAEMECGVLMGFRRRERRGGGGGDRRGGHCGH